MAPVGPPEGTLDMLIRSRRAVFFPLSKTRSTRAVFRGISLAPVEEVV